MTATRCRGGCDAGGCFISSRGWWRLCWGAEFSEGVEIGRPVLDDALLAGRFGRLFGVLTDAAADGLAVEEEVVRTLALLMGRHGSRRLASVVGRRFVWRGRCGGWTRLPGRRCRWRSWRGFRG